MKKENKKIRREVMQFFILFLAIVISFTVLYFFGFSSITGFAILVDPGSNVTTNSGEGSSFTHSHTVSGTNRLLVVSVALDDGRATKDVSNVTYAGQGLTQLSDLVHSGGKPKAEVWYLVAPPTGTNNVVVSIRNGQTNKVSIGAISYTGVDQNNSINGTVTAEGDGITAIVSVNSRTNDLVQDVLASNVESSPTVGAGQTMRWNVEIGGSGQSDHYGAGSTEPGASSVTMSWTLGAQADKWVMIGFNINAAEEDLVPNITIVYPKNTTYKIIQAELNYTVSDSNLNSCWYSLDNGATNTTITCGQNLTGLNSGEGSFTWTVYANDTSGNINFSRVSFGVDSITPNVSIVSPANGSTVSDSNVKINYTVSDLNLDKCWHTENSGVTNSSIVCGNNFSITAVEGENVVNIYANDSAGNEGFSSVTFTLSGSGGGGGSGSSGGGSGGGDSGSGGGGGGGGGSFAGGSNSAVDIEFAPLERVLIKRGTQESATLLVTNNGRRFLNSCKLQFSGGGSEWLSSADTKGLSSGEKFNFAIDVNVPEDANPGEYSIEVALVCDEGTVSTSLIVAPYRNQFEATIRNYEKEGNNLKVSYVLQEFAGLEHEILINYSLVDFDGVARYRGQEKVSLGARVTNSNEIAFALPKDSFGEFRFVMELNDGVSQSRAEEEVFLPSGGFFTGFTLFEDGKLKLSSFGVILVILIFLAIGYLLYRRFRQNSKKVELGFGKKRKRKVIALDM